MKPTIIDCSEIEVQIAEHLKIKHKTNSDDIVFHAQYHTLLIKIDQLDDLIKGLTMLRTECDEYLKK